MRASIAAVAAGAAGALGGGDLVGRWCLGLVLIILSAGLVAYGLLRDSDGERVKTAPSVRSLRPGVALDEVFDRARRAS